MEKLFIIDERTLQEFAERIVRDTCAKLNVAQGLNKNEGYISRKTASALLELDEATIWRYTKAGILKAYHIGNATRYKKDEVLKLVENSN